MKRDVEKGAAAKPERLPVRKLLKRFGYERRGEIINKHIRNLLAEPFLFVGEIEGHLRNLIHGRFTREQLQAATSDGRSIEGSADLTFGEHRQLLGKPENWDHLKLNINRKEFIANLETVQGIRNAIMHFNPDGLSDDDRQTVRKVARFFDKLAGMTHS